MKGLVTVCFAFFLLLNFSVIAQPVPGHLEPLQKPKELKKYDFHMFCGVSFLATGVKSDSIDYYKSGSLGLSLGLAYERLFGKHFALGIEALPVSYNWYTFKDGSFTPPDSISHKKQGYRGNTGQLGVYMRFSTNRYKEIAGFHVDLGANISIPYYYRYTQVDESGGYRVKQITSGLDHQPYYSLFTRIGFGAFDFYASYRLSDVFPNNSSYPQPPKINIGIQLELPDFNSSN
jgi:hypothetical protein